MIDFTEVESGFRKACEPWRRRTSCRTSPAARSLAKSMDQMIATGRWSAATCNDLRPDADQHRGHCDNFQVFLKPNAIPRSPPSAPTSGLDRGQMILMSATEPDLAVRGRTTMRSGGGCLHRRSLIMIPDSSFRRAALWRPSAGIPAAVSGRAVSRKPPPKIIPAGLSIRRHPVSSSPIARSFVASPRARLYGVFRCASCISSRRLSPTQARRLR